MTDKTRTVTNCPTSKRTGVGLCGEEFILGLKAHSCKLADDHEGPHRCDCASSVVEALPTEPRCGGSIRVPCPEPRLNPGREYCKYHVYDPDEHGVSLEEAAEFQAAVHKEHNIATLRAEKAELSRQLEEVVPQRNKWAMLCGHLGLNYKTTSVADIEAKLAEATRELEDYRNDKR